MTLPTAGHHARVVALGGIAKRKGVSSQASLLISVKCLWVTLPPLVTTPGQCPLISFLKEKEIRIKIKDMNWLGNICIHDMCNSPSTEAPIGKPCISLLSLHPLSRPPLPPHPLTWLGFDFSRKHPTSSEH
jgi:hypothetical protein